LQIIPRILRFILKPTNDVKHSLQNASSHYDTSNELFQAFLSPDMSYSCALWSGDPSESLESAQRRKVHNIIRKARISPGDHVLDIGGGWGFLAMEAVKLTNCRVTAITLSKEQKALAEENITKAGLSDKIKFLLCDYRNTPRPEGGYDRVVSVEMVEHVGKDHMDTFFAFISRLLKPNGGLMVLQGITIINEVG
jgi:cyclopropane-fatty-acyl-phospholipid synthase